MIFKQFHSILKKLIYFSLIITSNYQYVYASELSLQTVAEGFFVHQGQHAGLDVPEREDIANIGFIEGENCVAVIDTGGSIKIGDDLLILSSLKPIHLYVTSLILMCILIMCLEIKLFKKKGLYLLVMPTLLMN